MNREKAYTKMFREKIEARGWIYKKSTRDEDMYDHVDCHVSVIDNGRIVRQLKVELKGKKYTSRGNEGNPQEECQYIEFMNVRGDKGWLFGEAHYIAIEGDKKFYFIERTDLIKFSEELFKVNLNQSIEKIEEDLSMHIWSSRPTIHKIYRRQGRQDLVTQISIEEVKSLAKFTI
jgi:hypothetical protein